ncbi:MAG: formate dehydrogenase accessory sulfurtransferase FdhD [Anaerolineae bacterium]|nr:formate dehydrogenase accessory sulfurtransferase FdhD [Anaerolineae bacterium]
MTSEIFKPVRAIQCAASGSTCEWIDTQAVVEQAVLLTVNGEAWLTLICTPHDINALAIGFLYNEGIIDSFDEITSCQVNPDCSQVDVILHHPATRPDHWHRTITTMSSLPVDLSTPWRTPCRNQILLEPPEIPRLFRNFVVMQTFHNQVGGFHSAALSDGREILMIVEDIGRHNTLDKIAGVILLQQTNLEPRVVLVSGRISSEILFKTHRIGACMVISRTAPTSQSIHLAEEWDITLIGYARGERFTIYTHPERVLLSSPKK